MFDIREEISIHQWTNNCQIAVVPIINSEVFISGHGGPCIQAHLSHLQPDIANNGWRDYGNRQGTQRLLQIFSDLNISVSIAMNSYLIDKEPKIFGEIQQFSKEKQNIEIIGHGLTNSLSAVKHLTFEEQVKQSLDQIEQTLGNKQRPTSWLKPGFAAPENSSDVLGKYYCHLKKKLFSLIFYLVKNGIRMSLDATNDDILYKLKSSIDKEKELIILPYSMETNDISLCLSQGYTGEQYSQALIDYIQQLSEEKSSHARVVCLGLHTFIVGTPAKAFHFKKAIQQIKQIPNVAFFNCQQLLEILQNRNIQ